MLAAALTIGLMAACEQDEITTTTDTPTGSGVGSGDDNLDSVSVDLEITVTYASGGATVSGTTDSVTASVSGNQVTVTNLGTQVVHYTLSGSASNGYFKLYSGKKQVVTLNSLSLTNPNGAAINIQGPASSPSSGKRAFIVVQGSNTLADGSNYSATPSTEDEKAALFSEGKLVFSGSGSLTVTATGKAGITSDDYVHFQSGTYRVTSTAGHGVRGKDYILVSGGTLNVETSANMKKGFSSDSLVCFNGGETTIRVTGGAAYDSEDGEYTGTAGVKADVAFAMNAGTLTITNSGSGGKGISCDGTGTFSGGTVDVTVTGSNYTSGDISAKGIKCDGNILFDGATVSVRAAKHEAIESKGTITMNSGTVYSYSQGDDALNAASTLTVNGGYLCAHSTANDGMDANGNCYIKGGLVYAIGKRQPEVAIDANTEGGYKLYVEGGTLIAIGGLENNSTLTQTCYQAGSWTQNTWYALTVGSSTYAFKTPSSGGTPLVVSGASTPTLQSGVTATGGTACFDGTLLLGATVSGGSAVTLSSYTGGNGGGPGGGGHGPGGWK